MNVLSLFDGMSCGRIALERAGIKVGSYYASEIDKWAVIVSKANYKDIIHIGDVSKVSYADGILYTEHGQHSVLIDLLIGGSPCFVAGTKVFTSKGYKNIEDILVGDSVLTHENRYKPVLSVGGKLSSTVTLKAQGIIDTETTQEHPYLVRKMTRKWDSSSRRYKRVFSEPTWEKVSDLRKGDFVGVPIITLDQYPLELSAEDCWIIGRYIADGHIRNDKRKDRLNSHYYSVILSIGKTKLDYLKSKVASSFSCYEHGESVYRVCFHSKRLVDIIDSIGCGHSSEDKVIPETLLALPKELLLSVLDGYMSGDGSERNNSYRATTVSKELAMSISLAVAKVYGTSTSINFTRRSPTCVIEGRTVNQKDTYTVEFRKEQKKQSNSHVEGGVVWLPFKSVIPTGNMERVYNLEVADDNSYTANNAIVHNCQGFSMAGKQVAFDDERSKLYFEYERILKEIKAYNTNVKFLLENVKMKQEYKDVISERLGVAPIAINSNLVSAQNRYRLYWTNIAIGIEQPEDRGIYLKDILQDTVNDKYLIKAGRLKWLQTFGEVKEKNGYVAFNPDKAKCLTVRAEPSWNCTYILQWPHGSNSGGYRALDGKTPSMTISSWEANNLLLTEGIVRKLTPEECEKLQTVPVGYTAYVSDSQRYKMLGNGWTVEVIAHIFRCMQTTEAP